MEVLYPRCAGLDVHQGSVVACVRIANGARASHDVRTFETTTKGLLALADWLREAGCTHVAMESTGVYRKPVWHVLEGDFELVLANATHIRNVPGPGGHFKLPHLWPGQTPPPAATGRTDFSGLIRLWQYARQPPSGASSCLRT
jgi:hypothetical protein